MLRNHVLPVVLAGALAASVGTFGPAVEAHAKAVQIKPATSPSGAGELRFVAPFRFRGSRQENVRPTRLFVEFWDGSEYVFTPCRERVSRNCFFWPRPGFVRGKAPSVTFRGRVTPLTSSVGPETP